MISRPRAAAATVAILTAAGFAMPKVPVFAEASSAAYTISHQTLDFGGGHSASAAYHNVGSFSSTGSGSAVSSSAGSPIYFVHHGFIGQIHQVEGAAENEGLKILAIDLLVGTNGHIRIGFSGVPGRTYLIQATEDLTQPWQTIHTTPVESSDIYVFIDEDAGSYTQRFYRLVQE